MTTTTTNCGAGDAVLDATDAQILDPCWYAAALQRALLTVLTGKQVKITRSGDSMLEFSPANVPMLREMLAAAKLECQGKGGGAVQGRGFRFGPYRTMRRMGGHHHG